MHADQGKHDRPARKRLFRWAIIFIASLGLVCCGVPTLVYVYWVPSRYELQVGEDLPGSAEVLNSQYVFAGTDWTYRFEIAFEDDSARDQMVSAWQLLPGMKGQAYNKASDVPAWWPTRRISDIQLNGEWYSRDDDQIERWWRVWIDREKRRLYVETGRW